ncbi:MAG TPA: LysR family transcriptional regulator [Candidatus Limnocylindrales bacterium]|nr:LysR family transcriptional regulator [Candidatus Limnocylindrales bacterium]
MQLAQVEGFVEVAHRGTLSRAAETLYITQPALTARLRALEAEIATPLFRRGRRGMTLTDAGRAFLPHAERALRALRDGTLIVGQLPIADALVLGAAPAISTYTLPSLLVRFDAQRPETRLIVRTGHSEEILDQVVRGDIDVGLMRALHHPDLETLLLLEDELALVAQPDHPLARRRRISVGQVRDARLILFDRTSSFYDLTRNLFRQAGSPPRGVLELDNIDAAKQMVLAGLGVALLPLTAVANELENGRLRRVELVGTPPIERQIVAVRRRERASSSPAADEFWALLREVATYHRTDDRAPDDDRAARPAGSL